MQVVPMEDGGCAGSFGGGLGIVEPAPPEPPIQRSLVCSNRTAPTLRSGVSELDRRLEAFASPPSLPFLGSISESDITSPWLSPSSVARPSCRRRLGKKRRLVGSRCHCRASTIRRSDVR